MCMTLIGIGTDLVECLRIAQMIERHGELFITRVFTQHEFDYCSTRKAATQHYAGRFAAKEAILKAMGTGWAPGISWRDIEIRNDGGGKPRVALAGGARRSLRATGHRRDADQHLAHPHPCTRLCHRAGPGTEGAGERQLTGERGTEEGDRKTWDRKHGTEK